MKTKISILIAAVALVTLSFTFVSVEQPVNNTDQQASSTAIPSPVGGIILEEVAR